MDIMNKIYTFLNPETDEELDEIEVVEQDKAMKKSKIAVAKSGYVRNVANGTPTYENKEDSRPQFTLHTNQGVVLHNQHKFSVKIYIPKSFDDAKDIADDLKRGKMAVVNYLEVDRNEQIRICDFLNGATYVLKGLATRVSETIVMYAPQGVQIETFKSKAYTHEHNVF